MIDELLDFYNRELKFIRDEGRAFASLYPKIAARLKMSTGDALEDPHVSRLVESFALLCARLRLKIEDEFPEVCQSLLQALYPHYVSPVPPVGICRFKATELTHENPEGVFIRRDARLESEEISGQACIFRTCYATRVFPISIVQAEFQRPPFTFPIENTWSSRVEAAIRLRLRSDSDKLPIQKMQLSKLPLFTGNAQTCGNEIYEACLHNAVGVGLFSSGNKTGEYLSPDVIRPLGFGDEEALLKHDARTLAAYRFLWEFFVASDKFRFIELDLRNLVPIVARQDLDIVIYLNKVNPRIGRELTKDTLQLHCTPIVNLFRHIPEPIRLTGNQVEYRVVPSYRRPHGMEIFSIDRVTASSPGGMEYREFQAFHQPSHDGNDKSDGRFWQMSRRRRLSEDMEGDRGTEVFLSVVDLTSTAGADEEWTLHIESTCCNRDLVAELPSGLGEPAITLQESTGLIKADVISPLSPTRRPFMRDEYLWRLLSHLNLNHLTLIDSATGAESLREILRLYNPSDQDEHRKAIDSIQSVSYRRGVANVPYQELPGVQETNGSLKQRISGFCRGLEIQLVVDEERLVGMGVYLFASVLDRFFSHFATINSYTRLEVRSVSENQVLYRGKPRAGGSQLL